VSKNWNLIMRIITPVIYEPSIPSIVFQSNTPLNHLGTLGSVLSEIGTNRIQGLYATGKGGENGS
jgi:hypothetical protein